MPVNLDMFWLTGGIAVTAGFLVLVMIVRRDLAPVGMAASFGDGGGRIFLGAALGIGIIAFSLKMIVVLVLTSFPEQTITPLLAGDTNFGVSASVKPVKSLGDPPVSEIWTALPETAPAPGDNPGTAAKVALGRRLFNDANLSKDRTVSCASCHDLQKYAGADGRAVALGVGHIEGGRNTPTVLNAAYQARLFWDGRAASLEAQAAGPLLNPIEMAMPSATAVVERVTTDPTYAEEFQAAFGPRGAITMQNITQAIAAYERTLVTFDAPFDRFLAGDLDALSPAQKRGMYLFRKIGCSVCHAGPNFSGASRVGPRRPFAYLRTDRLAQDESQRLSADKGHAPKTSKLGLWRIPSLRNVALTGPYLHNGSIGTLREAVTIMLKAQVNADIVDAQDGAALENLSWGNGRKRFEAVRAKRVTAGDISDIVQFLHALSSARYTAQRNAKASTRVSQDTEAAVSDL